MGAWVAFFAAQLFSDVTPFFRDDVLTYLPLRQYLHQRLQAGELPAWYPYEGLGIALPGQLAVGLFHPATWLLGWMDYARALKWNLLLALLAALAGAYRWARACQASRPAALCAAFGFGFGGYALGTSSTLPYTMSFAALPWAGWALAGLVRRERWDYAGALAIALALVLLAGDPQSLVLSALLLPCALAGRPKGTGVARPVLLAAAAGACAALICAIDLLPGRVLFADSVRLRGHATADLARFWSLPPLRVLELLTPGFLPDAVLEPSLSEVLRAGPGVFCTTVFAGAVTVLLAVLGARGRRGLAFAALGLVALWLSLGEAGGLLPLVQKLFPPLARMRYPEKYLAFLWVAMAPLAAAGADRLLREPGRPRRTLTAGAIALAGLAFVAPMAVSARAPELSAVLGGAWRLGLLSSACFVAAALLISALPKWSAWLLPALVFAELLHGNADHLPMVPRALLDVTPPVVEQLKASLAPNQPPPRVLSLFPYPRDTATNPEAVQTAAQMLASLYPDVAGLYGIGSLGPRNGGFSMRYVALLGAANERAGRFGAWAGACWTVRADAERLSAADPAPCLGAAYLAGAVKVADARAAIQYLDRHPPTPPVSVPWEGGPDLAPPESGQLRWLRWSPELLELSVDASGPAALVVAAEAAPGWSASVDGAETPIHFTAAALQGIEVPAGTHQVRLEYHTPMLKPGAALSALGLLAAIAAIVFGRARRTARAPA